MEPTSALDRRGTPAPSVGASPRDFGLLEDSKSLGRELLGLAHDQLTLAVLDARLAAKSLVTMVAVGVIIAALLVGAWLGLLGAVVVWLIGIGVAASIGDAAYRLCQSSGRAGALRPSTPTDPSSAVPRDAAQSPARAFKAPGF